MRDYQHEQRNAVSGKGYVAMSDQLLDAMSEAVRRWRRREIEALKATNRAYRLFQTPEEEPQDEASETITPFIRFRRCVVCGETISKSARGDRCMIHRVHPSQRV